VLEGWRPRLHALIVPGVRHCGVESW
jgi:hypothetical protein